MNRRHFLATAGALGLGSLLLPGQNALATKLFCDGDLNVPLEGTIGHNHGHRLLIPRSDVLNGTDKNYDIQGATGHGHIVLVTQELFAQLRANGTLQLNSGTGAGHTHPITLVCAN